MKSETKSGVCSTLAHQQAAELLPWFVMGQLDAHDAELFAAHLESCAVCQADVEDERALRDLYLAASLSGEVQQIDVRAMVIPAVLQRPRHGWRHRLRQGLHYVQRQDRKMLAVVGGQAAAICLLLVSAPGVHPPTDSAGAPYRGLSSDSVVARGNALVMFNPEAPERHIRAALALVDATIVDGPGEGGAYLIQLAPAQRDQSLLLLRRQSAVILAEAVDAGDLR